MEDVNLATVVASTTPTVTLDFPQWDPEERTLTFSPLEPFAGCTAYTVTAQAQDANGNPLGPYSWTFATRCFVYIMWTNPADGETNVSLDAPLIVQFSGPINVATTWVMVDPTTAFTAGLLAPDGLWLSLIGSTEGAPREEGPPRRTAREVTSAIEPALEILELRSIAFETTDLGRPQAWFCLSRRRTVPAQPSTRRD